MKILTPDTWSNYQLLDTGDGQRLEKFGDYLLVRPDPQIIWHKSLSESEWDKADAVFVRSSDDKGNWQIKNNLPKQWLMDYQNIKFLIRLSPFKHTGVFPEQAVHWQFIEKKIKHAQSSPKILNLFGYTGIASLVAGAAGAEVTHVDASFPTIGWFIDNVKISELENKPIKWIEDDVLKFCERELRRGNKYDGIIMDPPSYGHGPKGETWKFNEHFPRLMEVCTQLLSDTPLFVIVNAYAISSSALTLENVLKDFLGDKTGTIESGELALKDHSGKMLSTGIFARWENK